MRRELAVTKMGLLAVAVLACLAIGCGDDSASSGTDGPGGAADLAQPGGGGDGATAGDLAMGPVAGEPAALAGITAAHNQARKDAMPAPSPAIPPLTWSDAIANDAQSWANGCMFKHSSNGHGENIYASGGSTPSGDTVVMSWVSEASNYNYAANSCSGTCGHYTQVVWRGSTQLGCGIKTCSVNSPFMGFPNWTFVVCDYNPPGNINGAKPY